MASFSPIRSRQDLLQQLAAGLHPDYLFFWGHRSAAGGGIGKGCLSQWWEAPFKVDGDPYRSAEHFMMVAKARLFGDAEIAGAILAAGTPAEAKKLGRQVRGFDEAVWTRQRFAIVVQANVEKFGHHPALADYLLGTGERVLVEASPVDSVWGIGLAATDPDAAAPAKWPGLNLLGFALMEARRQLRERRP